MSLDVYLAVAEPGISPAELREVFHLREAEASDSSDEWAFADCILSFIKGPNGSIVFVSVNRPTNDKALWDGLFAVLSRGDAVFFFPSVPLRAVVTDVSAIGKVATDLREFDEILVIDSAAELGASLV